MSGPYVSSLARAAAQSESHYQALAGSPRLSGSEAAEERRRMEGADRSEADAAWSRLVSACPGGVDEALLRRRAYLPAFLAGW